MKILKIVIVILAAILAVFTVWNKILLNKSLNSLRLEKQKIIKIKSVSQEIQNAVVKAQTASMMHLGKTIELTDSVSIFTPEQAGNKSFKHPRLLLVFSELGCNVCQDVETKFAAGIASEYGTHHVMAIVHAKNQRYARNYIRLNQVNFPVYFTSEDTFFNINRIINTPMIFVIDEDNRVIASHFPIPGHPEYSEPMHQFCYEYFNNVKK